MAAVEGGPWRPEPRFSRTEEHTADIWIAGECSNPDDLLISMLMSLYSLIGEAFFLEGGKGVEFTVKGSSPEEAMVRFLSECLYLLEGEGLLLTDPRVAVDGSLCSISVAARGHYFRIGAEGAGMEVKAITYHDVMMIRDGAEYKARVLVDL